MFRFFRHEFSYRIFNGSKSIKSVCKKNKIKYTELLNPNSLEFINRLKSDES